MVRAAVVGVFTSPRYRYDIVEQFDVIGVGSLTVVLLTGFFTGAALALQSGLTLDQFGGRLDMVLVLNALRGDSFGGYLARADHRLGPVTP